MANSSGVPLAIVHKTRISGEEVQAHRIVGDIQHCAPILVDDMISTGGTIETAVKALLAAGCEPDITVVASHALCVGPATERLRGLPVQRCIATDSVVGLPGNPLSLHVVSLDALLATAIRRLHSGLPLGDLIMYD